MSTDCRWRNSNLLILQSLPLIIKPSHYLVFESSPDLSFHRVRDRVTSAHNVFTKPTKPACVPAEFPWVMTELTTSKPAECQFHYTYRGPVLKSKDEIKQETIDGPAEAPAAPLLTTCHHLLGCQNNGLALLSICMHSQILSWFVYLVLFFLVVLWS